MLDKTTVQAALLHKLAGSKLSKDDLPALGYVAYTAAEMQAKLLKPGTLIAQAAAGFVIPYYDIDREWNGFFRYRYLEQPSRNGFRALATYDELRYIQPPNSAPRAYFSPLFDWKEFFKAESSADIAQRWLGITEGELKAACASSLGYPIIGIGGVWNFKTKSEVLIADIAKLPLKDRNVFIIFDSDAVTNPNVLLAENHLARALLNLKARPFIVRLPSLQPPVATSKAGHPESSAPKAKTGLDDYIVAEGKQALERLLAQAEEWSASRALFELNEEVIFLRDSATVMSLDTHRHRWRASEFTGAAYANRTYNSIEIVNNKAVGKEKRTAAEWLKWPGRGQVEGMTYAPGKDLMVAGHYNAWKGWGLPQELIKRGNIKPFTELVDYIFASATAEQKLWFLQWLAYPLQHPGAKMFTAVVLHGPSGAGKTLVGYTMGKIYGANFIEVGEADLYSPFNDWADCKQFVIGDEITGGDKRAHAEILKSIITRDSIRVNVKYVRPYNIPDCINYYFTSNHPDAFFINDDDRRYFVQEITQPPLPREFYETYDAWYKEAANIGHLFYHLLNLDLTGFNPRAQAPTTQAKEIMIELGRSDAASFCATLKTHPLEILNTPALQKRALFTHKELFVIYDAAGIKKVQENGMSRALSYAGIAKACGGKTVWLGSGLGVYRLWAVQNPFSYRGKLLDLTKIDAALAADIYREGLDLPPVASRTAKMARAKLPYTSQDKHLEKK